MKAQASVGIQILMKCNVCWQPDMVRGFLISDIPQNERNEHVDTRSLEKWRSFMELRAIYLQDYTQSILIGRFSLISKHLKKMDRVWNSDSNKNAVFQK